ncbi:hypothetical protein J41TS2_17420 [Bacillus sonorensis]|nr:hypothetical protein J41TS2_17420 [Bacillus sonorensis]
MKKTKLWICAIILLGAVGLASSTYVQVDNHTYKVADRFAS